MRDPVPASTRIRTKSIHNVDTDRLQRRRAYLLEHGATMAAALDGRPGLRKIAKELILINRELVSRRPS